MIGDGPAPPVGNDFIGIDKLAVGMILNRPGYKLNCTGTERIVIVDQPYPLPARNFDSGICRKRNAAIRSRKILMSGRALVTVEPGKRLRRRRPVVA